MVPTVPMTPTRRLRVAPDGGPHAGVDHADERDVVLEAQQVEGGRGRGVAGDDDQLDVVLGDQLGRDLAGEAA